MDSATPSHQTEESRGNDTEERDEIFLDEDPPDQLPPRDIVAYNESRSCAELFKMHGKGNPLTDPDFQRAFVWGNRKQTRFIDSLIKQLPIPSMCVALDRRRKERIVIDGRQRMSTIIRFLGPEATNWRLARLGDINQDISGRTLAQIKDENPEYFIRVEEHTLPVTVLDCEFSKTAHMDYIYMIFSRLNVGGERLNNQEIRNCIYGGPLNRLLRELDEVPDWRRINNMAPGDHDRFRKQELILRFFAFLSEGESYKGGMAKFLNNFMMSHRNEEWEMLQRKRNLFKRVVAILSKIVNEQAPQVRIPTNVIYPVMVGMADNVDALESVPPSDLNERFFSLREDEAFADQSGLASASVVRSRLQKAREIFGART